MRSGQHLGYFSLHPGLITPFCASGPCYQNKQRRAGGAPRMLYHSGLDRAIQYPYLPNRTHGFAYDIVPLVDHATQKTLSSNILQQWDAVATDVVIKEIYEGDIAAQWSFFHQLYEFWRTLLDPEDYLIWRPLDLTDKWYRVQIVQMKVGGDDNFNMTYFSAPPTHERWVPETVEVHLKLLPSFPPAVAVYASGIAS